MKGVGDQAQWADWADGSGGTLILQRGPAVLTITGTVKREAAVAAAKAALGRL